jgi:hypothetical protein
MSERDRDRNLDDLEPGEEEFDDELENGPEEEEAAEEFEPEAKEAAGGRRRFAGARHEADAPARRAQGSVRGSHERVHIDDRASIVFAILAAGSLIAVLVLGLVGNWIPQPSVPTLAPLVVPTSQVQASPSAGATVSPS